MSETTDEMRQRAHDAAGVVVDADPNVKAGASVFGRATLEITATVAWLDGYMAGHHDATQHAISALQREAV